MTSFDEINASFGKQGERVLGFAKCHLPLDKFPIGYNFNIYNMNFPFHN
jgi:sodium/potassium-transporting ATPase subunit alpha